VRRSEQRGGDRQAERERAASVPPDSALNPLDCLARRRHTLQIGSVRAISHASAAPLTRGASVARILAW
jgi:hypothetical protein